MAWIRQSQTNRPDRAQAMHPGEFVGNEVVTSSNQHDSRTVHENGLPPIVRAGRPRPQAGYSSEQMADMGYIGLYLIGVYEEDLRSDAIFIQTPPHLMEPGSEHLYNLDGRIGLAPEHNSADERHIDRQYIMYWQTQQRHNSRGETRVLVDYLNGKRCYTIPHFKKMVEEFRTKFPEAKEEDIICGKAVSGGSRFDGYSIVRWDTYLPASISDAGTVQYDSSLTHRSRRPDLYEM